MRQSSLWQVRNHLESQRRQYAFADQAAALGWSRERVVVIDEDQGKSGAIPQARAGFAKLVGAAAIFVDRTVWWDAQSPGYEDIKGIVSFALNDEGLLAYVILDAMYQPILFTGRAPNHERVLGAGDTRCGGTVSGFKFHRYGLNDAGEMALAVSHADQRTLLVRVEPTDLPEDRCITQVPEANAWLSALAALTALSVCGRARAGRSGGGSPSG